jgi:hypothetical protein
MGPCVRIGHFCGNLHFSFGDNWNPTLEVGLHTNLDPQRIRSADCLGPAQVTAYRACLRCIAWIVNRLFEKLHRTSV